MLDQKPLTIQLDKFSEKIVLDKIKLYLSTGTSMCHIVSLNPENCVIAYQNPEFAKVVATAQIRIVDGVGVAMGAWMCHVQSGDRITGVELMEELLKMANDQSLRVLLIGGKANLAVGLAECLGKTYPQASFKGLEGISNIHAVDKTEEKRLLSIVADYMPQIVLVAFGSPYQELWIEANKQHFDGMVVAGVGGAFAFLAGAVPRAPFFLRNLGLEWLFRLITQPWRWRRQLRLLTFIRLVLTKKIRFT